jgi:hypothetical protein
VDGADGWNGFAHLARAYRTGHVPGFSYQKVETFGATTFTNFFDKFSFSILDRSSSLGQK